MKNPLASAIAGRVQQLRETAGLSQQEVAQRGDLSLSLVAKLEQGKKGDPRASSLLALASALGVKPGALLDDLELPANGAADEAASDGKKKPKKKKKNKAKQK